MGKSLFLGRYAGIPIYVHWTFGLLLLSLAYFCVHLGLEIQTAAWLTLYVFTLFFCVILHEYGHALMARKFGVDTRDIIISPIGGLARLERMPIVPKQELLIAIAGPLVNVAIALLLVATMSLAGIQLFAGLLPFPSNGTEYIQLVLLLNIVLFFFNLVPALSLIHI